MQTRTYTERKNARRAAKAAGVNPDLVFATEDGFAFPPPVEETEPTNGHAEPTPLKQAIDAAVEQGISPKQFVAIAEGVADNLDAPAPKVDDVIPAFCRIDPAKRKAAWEHNPPKAAPAIKEDVPMAKARSAKAAKSRGSVGTDKNATLLKMLDKGATVEALCKATDWLPHTLRARISHLNKPKSKGGEGLKIERERTDGVTTYRIAS